MEPKELYKLLSDPAKLRLDLIFPEKHPKRALFLRKAAEFISEMNIIPLDLFICSDGFSEYIKTRLSSSPARIEHTLELFLRRIALEINPDTISEIASAMSGKKFTAAERGFFKAPIDRDAYELFEFNFMRVGEQNHAKLEGFLDFFLSDRYAFFKARYRADDELFRSLIKNLTDVYLGRVKIEEFFSCADFFLIPEISGLIFLARKTGDHEKFIMRIFESFFAGINTDGFADNLKVYYKRYKTLISTDKQAAAVYSRLGGIWLHLYFLASDNTGLFKKFVEYYGDMKDDLEKFIWETAFSLNPEKAAPVLTLLTSGVFTSLKSFYQNDSKIIKFLIKNIVAVLAESDIKDIGVSLYRIVLKLLLAMKVDKRYLKRRADFFAWMKTRSTSLLVELQVVRIIIFEYIFIALKLVPQQYNFVMTKHCDKIHAKFCDVIDGVYSDPFAMRTMTTSAVFEPLLEMFRNQLWKDNYEKYDKSSYRLNEVRGLAENLDLEDSVLSALESVEPEEIIYYHDSLMNVFRNYPEKIDEAVMPDYWHRIVFADAHPYAKGALLPVIGGVRILEGTGGAYTDGLTIYLPPYINYFKDRADPILENRNLTFYIALAFHEAGHIIAGSFAFNLTYYMSVLEMPDLFKSIMNSFEDYRVESFLMKINVHHQIDEIISVMNRYFSIRNFINPACPAFAFISYIFDEAGGYNDELKLNPQYNAMIESIMNLKVNTGRFRSLADMADYGIERLTHLDVANPLAAYPLAREFYEIMKHWPESAMEGMLDPARMNKGIHAYSPCEDGGVHAPRQLTREELDDVYREYNNNPTAFLEGCGLPVYPELIPGAEGGSKLTPGQPSGAGEMLSDYLVMNYEDEGTIDFSHRTKADDVAAQNQLKASNKTTPSAGKKPASAEKKKDKKVTVKKKKKYVYNINPRTRSRTKLSEIKEFRVTSINRNYFKTFSRWDHISNAVYRQLSRLIPSIEEKHDTSAFDGEMNIELLIEAMSEKNRFDAIDIFDIYQESRRSLEIAIGLDASGSTGSSISGDGSGLTILDIEKAFAMIFGRAMSHLTPNVSIYAFDSVTSTNIYRAATIDAVSSFVSGASNRDGDFVRYVKDELAKSDAEVKYFFFLSDGKPAADNYDGKEALDDTLIAMRETVNEGIKLIYFNFDFVLGEYFEHFRHEATYARYFTDPRELLPVIPELVNTIVKSIR